MSAIAEDLRAVDGADARVIAHLEANDFRIQHMRPDVESQYSGTDLEEAYYLIMANQVNGDNFTDLIGEDFDAQTLFFESVVVLVIPSERYEGASGVDH